MRARRSTLIPFFHWIGKLRKDAEGAADKEQRVCPNCHRSAAVPVGQAGPCEGCGATVPPASLPELCPNCHRKLDLGSRPPGGASLRCPGCGITL